VQSEVEHRIPRRLFASVRRHFNRQDSSWTRLSPSFITNIPYKCLFSDVNPAQSLNSPLQPIPIPIQPKSCTTVLPDRHTNISSVTIMVSSILQLIIPITTIIIRRRRLPELVVHPPAPTLDSGSSSPPSIPMEVELSM